MVVEVFFFVVRGDWVSLMNLVFYLLIWVSFLFGDLRFILSIYWGYGVEWLVIFDFWYLGVVII